MSGVKGYRGQAGALIGCNEGSNSTNQNDRKLGAFERNPTEVG